MENFQLVGFHNIKNIDELVKKYDLTAKYSVKYPELVCLCYHQTNTPKNTTTNQCRGIVVNKDTFDVVSYPFYRFSDYDPKKHKLDFKNGIFNEKIDGSIFTLYYYKGEWNVSTKTTPNAHGYVEKDNPLTMSEYFFNVLGNKINHLDTNYFYICEFKFPSNSHHFIKTEKEEIYLIGLRNKNTLIEENPLKFANIFPLVKNYYFNNHKEMDQYINGIDPTIMEGFVYVDYSKQDEYGNFIRYKVKSPQFDLINLLRIKDYEKPENKKLNYKWLEQICNINNHRTFLQRKEYSIFSDYVKNIDEKIKINNDLYEKYKHLTDPKIIGQLDVPQEIKTRIFIKLKNK